MHNRFMALYGNLYIILLSAANVSKLCAAFRRGIARIFQRGDHRQGHHPGIADYIWFIPLLSLVYQQVQSCYCSMKVHIN